MFAVIGTVILGVLAVGGTGEYIPDPVWHGSAGVEWQAPPIGAQDRDAKWLIDGHIEVPGLPSAYTPLAEGDEGEAVKQLQRQLAALHLYRGEIDGKFGREVKSSVVAAHKLLNLDRTEEWQSSDWISTRTISHRVVMERHALETDRIEVDLENQLLYVIRGSEVAAVLHISTGNGETYWSKNGGSAGGYVRATTPQGDFTVFKHIPRWRQTYLGGLYKPWYFTPYYAVHGSRSVPAVPASHGCVRVPVWESDHLDDLLEIGLPIHIWDA